MSAIKHYPDILDCIANLSNDEVFTPPVLVNKVLDLLPSEVWINSNLKWLDPCCKTGVFLREIAKRLMIGLSKEIPNEDERREHIFKKMLWGIALTELTALTSRRSLYYSKNPQSAYSIFNFENNEGNIFYQNINHTFTNGHCNYCGTSESGFSQKGIENSEMHAYNFIHEEINLIFKRENMKFDVIVGNPPYQINDGGAGASAKPLYHKFIEQALKLNPKYLSMIIPSRWFVGGKGLDEFRNRMINDKRIKTLVDYSDSSDCFPGVKIEGGVCYFLLDKDYNGDCTIIENNKLNVSSKLRSLNEFNDVFVRYNKATSILNKILNKRECTLNLKVSSRKPFGLPTNFTNFTQNKTKENNLKLISKDQTIGFISENLITQNHDLIKKYKILASKAYGYNGNFPHQITGNPIFAEPGTACTETYLIINSFNTKEECENFHSYFKTKFFRFLVLLRKPTQDMPKNSFAFVPDLNMDKVWTDEELYKKYNLSIEEIAFIETMVKEMR